MSIDSSDLQAPFKFCFLHCTRTGSVVTTTNKAMKCIKVNALFELVTLVQKDIDAEQGVPDFKLFFLL